MARVSIFLVIAALIAGIVGCGGFKSYTLTIGTIGGGNATSHRIGINTFNSGTLVNLVAQR